MDAQIEVAVMTAGTAMVTAVVMAVVKISSWVSRLVSQTTAASILRSLRQGRSSLSAVPGDSNFNLGGAYALA